MTARPSPTARRRRLGVQLRQLRLDAGLTLDKVAEALKFSESKLSRIETGRISVSTSDVRELLELYGIPKEEGDELIQAAEDALEKAWWQAYSDVHPSAYLGLEAAADQIRVCEVLLVPGLLQTPAYARTVIGSLHPNLRPGQIERWVQLREVRQALLKQDDPPAFSAIIDEGVLRRPVGGRDVMREQLHRLVRDSALDSVTLQVLPLDAGEHPAMYGSFTILNFRDSTQPDLVYLENATRELYLEGEEELFRYTRIFDRLRDCALDPDASAALLTKLSKEL